MTVFSDLCVQSRRFFPTSVFIVSLWLTFWGCEHKKGAGVSARTLEDSSLNEPSANLGRLLAAAAQGHGSDTCQRKQRPARLRHGTDVPHSDGGAWHGLDVSGVKREGFR